VADYIGAIKQDAEAAAGWAQKIGSSVYRTGTIAAKSVSGKLKQKADKAVSIIGNLMDRR
jgi:hypothetical protein